MPALTARCRASAACSAVSHSSISATASAALPSQRKLRLRCNSAYRGSLGVILMAINNPAKSSVYVLQNTGTALDQTAAPRPGAFDTISPCTQERLMELIKDKVVIVTGAAAGIGAGVAKLFSEDGAHVFLADLDGPGVKNVATTLQAEGGSAFGFEANAGSRDAMAKVVEDAMTRFGR